MDALDNSFNKSKAFSKRDGMQRSHVHLECVEYSPEVLVQRYKVKHYNNIDIIFSLQQLYKGPWDLSF